MSGHLRRTIANRILRTLSRHGKLPPTAVERLEKNVALLVSTQDVRKKTRPDDPQFGINLSKLAWSTQVSSDFNLAEVLKDIVDDDTISACQLNKKKMLISVDSKLFHKFSLKAVQNERTSYGSSSFEDNIQNKIAKPTVLVEYSSPNVAKPFHAGHLRSTLIGNFLSNLYELTDHKVHRINYLGDWGTQFGILALGFQRFGKDNLLKEDPLLHLFEVYVKINQDVSLEKQSKSNDSYKEGLSLFTRLEQGDPEIVSLWLQFRNLSINEYDKMYKRLGVSFTETHCESQYSKATQDLMDSLRSRQLLETDEKGVGYMMVEDQGSELKATLLKSDGSSLYLGRDVAAALDRQDKYSPDIMHYVVEGGQQLHFKQLTGILRQLGVPWASRPLNDVHIKFGRVEGMSSRRGTVVFLQDILNEAKERALLAMRESETTRVSGDREAVGEVLGVSGVVVQDLAGRRCNNYAFSWDRMLSFTGDSGVSLQYTHARLCSLLSSFGLEKTIDVDVSCLDGCQSAHQLMLAIARFPELTAETLDTLEPCHIVQYLFKLSHLINAAYTAMPVKGQPRDVAQARLVVFDSARQVLSNGMKLIGLQPLSEM